MNRLWLLITHSSTLTSCLQVNDVYGAAKSPTVKSLWWMNGFLFRNLSLSQLWVKTDENFETFFFSSQDVGRSVRTNFSRGKKNKTKWVHWRQHQRPSWQPGNGPDHSTAFIWDYFWTTVRRHDWKFKQRSVSVSVCSMGYPGGADGWDEWTWQYLKDFFLGPLRVCLSQFRRLFFTLFECTVCLCVCVHSYAHVCAHIHACKDAKILA